MSGKLLVASDRRTRNTSPFGLHWGTEVPGAGLGVDNDLYIRYGDTDETFYKKRSGAWELTGGGGFSGFDSSNSELFELSADASSQVVSKFTIAADSKLVVEKDGIKMYEGKGFTRNTGTNAIDFDETILADANSKVLVFVGLYS